MKAPWQMTHSEWDTEYCKARPNIAQSRLTRSSQAQAVARFKRLQFLKYGAKSPEPAYLHVQWSDVIAKALREGQPVPVDVLADYAAPLLTA